MYKILLNLWNIGEKNSLEFWFSNIEVYILSQSYVYNSKFLKTYLEKVISALVG